jgi:iron complex transport system substrate-binding protein
VSLAPTRIVSLTAALTETLFAIGAQDRVVAVTDTCDFPAEARRLPNVGCWFEPDLDKLFDLRPDLVLGLETAHGRFRPMLEGQGMTVLLSNPATVEESLALIAELGDRLGDADRAQACVAGLRERLHRLDAKVAQIPEDRRPTVSRVLHLSEEGIIVAGPRSFQYDVIARAGGRNVSDHLPESYPKVGFAQFRAWDPAVVFFCGSDRTFVPRLRADEKWRTLRAVRDQRVYQFDCGLTCRTGPRIVDMAELLHDTLFA